MKRSVNFAVCQLNTTHLVGVVSHHLTTFLGGYIELYSLTSSRTLAMVSSQATFIYNA